jgi:para-nitrobenzyl esterase
VAYWRAARAPAAARDPEPGMFELQEEVMRRRRGAGEPWFLNLGPAAPPLAPR